MQDIEREHHGCNLMDHKGENRQSVVIFGGRRADGSLATIYEIWDLKDNSIGLIKVNFDFKFKGSRLVPANQNVNESLLENSIR